VIKSIGSISFVRISDVSAADAEAIRLMRNLPETREYMYTDHSISPEEHRKWLNGLRENQSIEVFVIYRDSQPIGVATYDQISKRNLTAYGGLYLDPETRGSSVYVLAQYALLQYAFEGLGLEKMNCETLETNLHLVKLLKRFGFEEEGLLRSNVVKGGVRVGVRLLGQTADEWNAVKGKFDVFLNRHAKESIRAVADAVKLQTYPADTLTIDDYNHLPQEELGVDLFRGRLASRPATERDVERFWKWSNDPSVRSNCYNPDPIPLEVHREWFAGKLAAEGVLILVFELDGVPVGQIRYDRSSGLASIGFSIDTQFRGMGLGRKIIEQSLDRAFSELGVDAVRAEVFRSNLASQSVLEKTGFKLIEKCEINGIPSLVYVKRDV